MYKPKNIDKLRLKKTMEHVGSGHKLRTRRDFLGLGLVSGIGSVFMPTIGGVMIPSRVLKAAVIEDCGAADPNDPAAVLSANAAAMAGGPMGAIIIEASGGANFVGNNVMVGGVGGQMDKLSNAAYTRLGIIEGEAADVTEAGGLMFHARSGILAGLQSTAAAATLANTTGQIFCSKSENDGGAGGNRHNPAFALSSLGGVGSLTGIAANNDRRSAARNGAIMNDANVAKSVIQDPSSVTALVGGGGGNNDQKIADNAVKQAIAAISGLKVNAMQEEAMIKEVIHCASLMSAKQAEDFADTSTLDPLVDANLLAAFPEMADNNDNVSQAASIAKLVVNSMASVGVISLGGYDYHGGGNRRVQAEQRDTELGEILGSVLTYAELQSKPVMVFVISNGSVSATRRVNNNVNKIEWGGDESATAAAISFLYNPAGKTQLLNPGAVQVGFFTEGGVISADSGLALADDSAALGQALTANYLAATRSKAEAIQMATAAGFTTVVDPKVWDRVVAYDGIPV